MALKAAIANIARNNREMPFPIIGFYGDCCRLNEAKSLLSVKSFFNILPVIKLKHGIL